MKEKDDRVNITVYEGDVNDKMVQKDNLDEFFKVFLKTRIPSSMPCPCLGRIMFRDQSLCGKRNTQKHPMIIGVKIKILGEESTPHYSQIMALCEDCYKEGIKTIITAPRHYIVRTEMGLNM